MTTVNVGITPLRGVLSLGSIGIKIDEYHYNKEGMEK
jgi:hypothetical protein